MSNVRIIVGQRGWVHVGVMSLDPDGMVVVTKAKNIRRWGTTKGLGELVAGPQSETVLDHVGTMRMHPLQIIMTYDADADAWRPSLDSA